MRYACRHADAPAWSLARRRVTGKLALIAIISVLGSVLLLGGGYAIWDGWPYLVLERGFTQVILGAVAAAAGLLLLALVPVLGELRRLRSAVTGLAAVSAQASLLPEIDSVVAVAPARPEPAVAAPIALGAAGAVAATAAAAGAKADTANTAEPSPEPTTAVEPPVDETAAHPDVPADDEADERIDPAASQEKAEIAAEDPVEPEATGPVEPVEERELADSPASDATEPAREDAHIPWPSLDDRPGDAGDIPWPTRDSALAPSTGDDDLGLLREQLTLGPRAPDWRRTADEEIAVSGAWMNAPVADDADDAAGSDMSLRREEPAPPEDEPDSGSDPWTWPDTLTQPSAEGSTPETTGPAGSDLLVTETATDEPVTEPLSEPVRDEADDEPEQDQQPEQPAASDEGVIGAYQVGDTHFTMFADGSIRARTREGEYTFASMDELKAYLASEKSRLDA